MARVTKTKPTKTGRKKKGQKAYHHDRKDYPVKRIADYDKEKGYRVEWEDTWESGEDIGDELLKEFEDKQSRSDRAAPQTATNEAEEADWRAHIPEVTTLHHDKGTGAITVQLRFKNTKTPSFLSIEDTEREFPQPLLNFFKSKL